MALTQLSIRRGYVPTPVNATPGGSLFTNGGPDSVWYGPSRDVTSSDGTEITSGGTATLTGTQYLTVAPTATLAKVSITPTYPDDDGEAEVLTRLQVTGNTGIGGTLAVTGAQTLTGATAMAGAVTMTKATGTGLAVTSNQTVGGTLAVTGASTLTGAVSAAKATGTGLAVTADATVGGTLGVTGASTLAGAVGATKATGTGLAVTADATVGGTLGVTGVTTTGGLSLTDATDVTIDTTTGSKIGQSGSKIGFYGATPVVQRAAYTQTYSTADRTVPDATFVAPATTGATNVTPFGYAEAQANAIVTGTIANAADILALKKVVTALIDDLQALGLAQ